MDTLGVLEGLTKGVDTLGIMQCFIREDAIGMILGKIGEMDGNSIGSCMGFLWRLVVCGEREK